MSQGKQEMPEWLRQAASARALIDAFMAAYSGGCDCTTCRIMRDLAESSPPFMPSLSWGQRERGAKRSNSG